MTHGRADAAAAFAPEAHLPQERRLLVDGSGVTLETSLGLRRVFPWASSLGVLVWSDRAELLLDDELSIVIRASDWHRGSEALQAIRDRCPEAVRVVMPDDPEPEPSRYLLRGLASVSSAVLIVLIFALAFLTVLGIGLTMQDSRPSGVVFDLTFGVATIGVLRSLIIRLRVPRRWRDAASVRGRTAVALNARIARASDRALRIAEPALYALTGIFTGLFLLVHVSPLPLAFLLSLALAVRHERLRRRCRLEDV